MGLQLEYCVQCGLPRYKEGTEILEQARQRDTKMIGSGTLLMLEYVSSAIRRLLRKLITVGSAELTRPRFSIVHSERMRDFGHNFQHVTFRTLVRKRKLLNLRVTKHWTRLLKEAVEFEGIWNSVAQSCE